MTDAKAIPELLCGVENGGWACHRRRASKSSENLAILPAPSEKHLEDVGGRDLPGKRLLRPGVVVNVAHGSPLKG